MSYSGDAAEQVVKMSLDGVEIAARITGSAAKEIAVMIIAALKNRGSTMKTKGKERLTTMLKSGKALEIFSVKERDLAKFAEGAKQYGIVYCVLRNEKISPDGLCDIMVKADDAPRISRIIERFRFATVDKARIENEIVTDREARKAEPPIEYYASAEPLETAAAEPSAPSFGDAMKDADDLISGDRGKAAHEMTAADILFEMKAPLKEAADESPLAFGAPEPGRNPSGHTSERSASSAGDIMGKPLVFRRKPSPETEHESINSGTGPGSGRHKETRKAILHKSSVKEEIREIRAVRKSREADAHRRDEPVAGKSKEPRAKAHQQPQTGGRKIPVKMKSKGAR